MKSPPANLVRLTDSEAVFEARPVKGSFVPLAIAGLLLTLALVVSAVLLKDKWLTIIAVLAACGEAFLATLAIGAARSLYRVRFTFENGEIEITDIAGLGAPRVWKGRFADMERIITQGDGFSIVWSDQSSGPHLVISRLGRITLLERIEAYLRPPVR